VSLLLDGDCPATVGWCFVNASVEWTYTWEIMGCDLLGLQTNNQYEDN
jgi:hypothetical protein